MLARADANTNNGTPIQATSGRACVVTLKVKRLRYWPVSIKQADIIPTQTHNHQCVGESAMKPMTTVTTTASTSAMAAWAERAVCHRLRPLMRSGLVIGTEKESSVLIESNRLACGAA